MVVRPSALQRGAIKMRRRHLESVSAVLYGRCFGSFVFSRSLAAKRFAKGKARFPFALFCFLLQEQKEGPRGERYLPSLV